ncbi:putative adenosine/adenine deaminase [Asanoa ishikariensis]|uniref:Adenosine deaminase n=1 Tax=Asanoa ishikariensis TaxID=137265 RepID=A0A1H3UNN4_9ACTN|nr:adenosine deaminase [Asanoa ishikariensis]GIF69042.1 putative adenosine/adenine deaminase [Asanoa ishikariensis]SDZ63866.1 adenosine deaminase [Asanoa ishikariensis]
MTAATLPKTNLHLHLTGAMRPSTLAELAARAGLPLPPPFVAGTVHEWAAFQERYDLARATIRGPEDIERVVVEAAEDDAACGARWVELQVDPTSYAVVAGSLHGAVEAALAGAARAPIPVGIVVAASWAAGPEHALRLAKLAAAYADRGVVGFGLSNDERLGSVADLAPACRLAAEAGLLVVPHGGFYTPASHVADCVTVLGAHRIGHGLAAMHDPATRDLLAERGVALEVCPTSYPPLGVAAITELPIRELRAAGVPVALGTDDPLLFGGDLTTQYALVTSDPAEQADLARCSITASAAPAALKEVLLR